LLNMTLKLMAGKCWENSVNHLWFKKDLYIIGRIL